MSFPETPFPEANRRAVERALEAAFGTTTLDAATSLTGGLSGARVFKIRVGGIAYLLRIEGQSDFFRNPSRWYGCMRTAAEAGVAPKVHYACVEDGVAIMDFIAERSLSLEYAGSRSDRVTELAQAVRALHATPAFPRLVDYLDGMEALIGQFRASGLIEPAATAEHFARYSELAAAYRRLRPDPVSSHNDLNPRNVLYDGGRLWLIDWESSFLADRYVDLATLANFFTANAEEEAMLLRTYFGETPDAARQARMFLMRQLNHVFYAMSFLNGAAAERPGVRLPDLAVPPLAKLHQGLSTGEFVLETWQGRVDYGRSRLNEALANIKRPEFEAAVRLAA